MRKKRFLAVVLSTAMVMSSAVVASAAPTVADGSKPMGGSGVTVTGRGEVTGLVNENIFNVIVPTTVSESSIFDYILDPQGLIEASQGAKYISNNATVDGVPVSINSGNQVGYTPSSLYFVNSANDADDPTKKKLTNTSDPYIIKNKSTMQVDLSINATLRNGTGITVSTDETFNGGKDTNKSMYMALLLGNGEKKTISGSVATSTYMAKTTLDSAKDFYVKTVSTGSGEATYEIPSANESTNAYPQYSFRLTGACNTAADWSSTNNGAGLVAPQVDVVYYVTEHVDIPAPQAAPSIGTTTYRVRQGNDVEIAVNLGEGDLAATGIYSIMYDNSSGVETELTSDKYEFDEERSTIIIYSSYIDALYNSLTTTGRQYRIMFDDEEETTIEVTLRK